MANYIIYLLFLCFIPTSFLYAEVKVIYGSDDRVEAYQQPSIDNEAVAAMFHVLRLKKSDDGYLIRDKSLLEYGYCEDEPFATQAATASCTGFLVDHDLLLTAAHCIHTLDECRLLRWVFGHRLKNDGSYSNRVSDDSVYRCVEIVERGYSYANKIDYALVRLDRNVPGRTPLAINHQGKVNSNDELKIIGHPFGLPLKVAAGAKVRNNSHLNAFIANLDAYGGNSGSPVISMESGLVEGILVKGEDDYIFDRRRDCKRSKVCRSSGCSGEQVTRVSIIEYFKQM